jgi:type IV pilus assembly protein PilQ
LDNQSATIESGDEIPYQTTEDGEVKIEYKKAVLRLKVTPHVIEGETLKLNIETSKDEINFSRTVMGNPTIITKKAETNVVLFDGQTTVIGGLNKETNSNAETGVPGLMNIPILGWMFRGKEKTNKMEEVLIFITPHILKQRTTAVRSDQHTSPASTPKAP